MSNKYLDPNGKEITFKAWKKRIPAEYVLHEHKTAKTITRLLAADIIMDANLIPAERHKRYKMESTNILTHDAMGEAYAEPRYVEDEFARKSFATKEKAIDGYVAFLVEWCKGDDAALRETLAREVPVTVVPVIDLKAKDMELKSLSARIPAKPAPTVSVGDEADPDDDDEDDGIVVGKKPTAADFEREPVVPRAKGSDKPTTAITDDIGSW